MDRRVERLGNNIMLAFKKPFGIGFRIDGKDSLGRGFPSSATAPVKWFVYTGYIGIALLFLREMQVVTCFADAFRSHFVLKAFQAWIVLLFQHLVYGTWMTPLYLLLSAMVLSSVCREQLSRVRDAT